MLTGYFSAIHFEVSLVLGVAREGCKGGGAVPPTFGPSANWTARRQKGRKEERKGKKRKRGKRKGKEEGEGKGKEERKKIKGKNSGVARIFRLGLGQTFQVNRQQNYRLPKTDDNSNENRQY